MTTTEKEAATADETAAPREDKDPTGRQEIRFRRRGDLAEVILTRPKALNALTKNMIDLFDPYLVAWASNPAVKAVAISGDGDKAFCAGGDVRSVWDSGRDGGDLTRSFFQAEYTLNRRIRTFPKPYIALVDGITMGGGVGVSVHGDIRIAGDRTMMAMPEMGIGFFTDVGTTHVLSRLPGQLGMYLALTGYRMKAADAVYTGMATHYVPTEEILGVVDACIGGTWRADDPLDDVRALVDQHAGTPGPAPLAAHREAIDRCFAGASVEAIRAALAAEDSDWARDTLAALAKGSPTSLKVTHAALRRAASLDFDSCLKMEYRMSQAFMAGHDFYEGIRAVLVDKDHAPAWKPATLEEISDAAVEAHFAVPPGGDLEFA